MSPGQARRLGAATVSTLLDGDPVAVKRRELGAGGGLDVAFEIDQDPAADDSSAGMPVVGGRQNVLGRGRNTEQLLGGLSAVVREAGLLV